MTQFMHDRLGILVLLSTIAFIKCMIPGIIVTA